MLYLRYVHHFAFLHVGDSDLNIQRGGIEFRAASLHTMYQYPSHFDHTSRRVIKDIRIYIIRYIHYWLITCLMESFTMSSKEQECSSDYGYTFLSEPDDSLRCLICLGVAVEPWQHSKCGRLFCKTCLDVYKRNRPCPNCREERPQYFEDNKSKFIFLYFEAQFA